MRQRRLPTPLASKSSKAISTPVNAVGGYASGVGRRWIGLFWRAAFEPGRIFFVHAEEIDQVFDAEVGECRDTILPDAVNPDDVILNLHFDDDIAQQIFIFTKILCDLGNGGNVMDFIDVGGHAARADIADAGVQFHGSNSSSRWAG